MVVITCIIALKDENENRVIVGADGQGTSDDVSLNFGEKIFSLNIPVVNNIDEEETIGEDEIYFLIAGSHYLESYLKSAFTPPSKLVNEDILDYLYNQFFQVLNNELTLHGLLKNKEGALESEAGLIIIYEGRLFNVYSDFSIVEDPNQFTVHGSGWKIATSVLTNLLEFHSNLDKKKMVEEALWTTGELNIYCNKDIHIKEIIF